MDVRLGKKIAEGACSEIYEWEDDSKIIKLAKANTDDVAMKNEFHNNLIAWESGLPAVRPFELLEIDGRPGIVFERIYGETLLERSLKKIPSQAPGSQEIEENDIRITARLLYQIHSKSGVKFPLSQRDYFIKYDINRVDYLTVTEKETVIALLDQLPAKQSPCHGDPNPNNIFIRHDGQPVIIDWMNAAMGNPEADLAEYIIMYRYAVLPTHLPAEVAEYFEPLREPVIDIFMDEYHKLSGITYDEVSPWLVVSAARKLSADGIAEAEKELLVGMIRQKFLLRMAKNEN